MPAPSPTGLVVLPVVPVILTVRICPVPFTLSIVIVASFAGVAPPANAVPGTVNVSPAT